MPHRYLIFQKGAHSVVHFVHGESCSQALWNYILINNPSAVLDVDGSIDCDGTTYASVLAYIESCEKIHGEFQIRQFPEDWDATTPIEAFCGESSDGPGSVIKDCLGELRNDTGLKRPRAFVWYLTQGTLVTFYRKPRSFMRPINVIRRYLWNYDGRTITVVPWASSDSRILESLNTKMYPLKRSPQGK
jgi:hypothetical protein